MNTKIKDIEKLKQIIGRKSNLKWTDLYENEENLLKDFILLDEKDFKCYQFLSIKGVTYFISFKKYYKINGCLTTKQLTQLKRIAKELVKYHIIKQSK